MWLMLIAANTSAHAQASNPSPADWTQFHRDNMQRWNPYETVLGANNTGSLGLKWASPLGNESNESSSPAVANGVVYVGSSDGNVYALDASSGAKLWSYATGASIEFSSPAVANGVVYVGSVDKNVYALNASTGAKLWSFTTGNLVNSSPTVANGVVYIGSFDGNLSALNASTGAEIWSYNVGTFGYVNSSPVVINGVVYLGFSNSFYSAQVLALSANTGAKLWSYDTGSFNELGSSPAVANGVVYIGLASIVSSGQVLALSASTGAQLWSYAPGNAVSSSPAVANGVVDVGSEDNNVYALNASTGVKLWSFTAGAGVFSSPAVADGVVYVHAINSSFGIGNLFAFSSRSSGGADLFLRIQPTPSTVHQGDLLTFAFPIWNLGPNNADFEVLNTQVPPGTTFDYIRISGTPGLGTCTTPPYQATGKIVCHENSSMAPNTTWTVRLTVKVTAPAGTVISESAATMADTPDPNLANNTATVNTTVQ